MSALMTPLDQWVRLAVVWALPWFVFVPYVPIPGTPLSLDDVLPLAIAAAGTLAAARGRMPRPELVCVGLAVFALHQMLTTLFAEGGDGALLAGVARGAGRTLVFAALAGVVLRALGDRRDVVRHLQMWVAAAAAQALFSGAAYLTRWHGPFGVGMAPRPVWSNLDRVHGTFAAPGGSAAAEVSANFLSAYLMVAALVALGLGLSATTRRPRGLYFAAAGACTLGIGVSFGRASLLGLAFGVAVIALLARRFAVVGVMTAVAALSLVLVPGLGERLGSMQSDRLTLYASGLAIADDHPLVGVGDGNYAAVMESDPRDYRVSAYGVSTSTPHSSVLLAASHGGWIAGAILLGLVLAVAGRNVVLALGHRGLEERGILAGLAAAALAFVLHDQVNNLLYVPKTAAFFWLAGVLALAVHRSTPVSGAAGARVPARGAA